MCSLVWISTNCFVVTVFCLFGEVVEGFEIMRAMEKCGSQSGKCKQVVRIEDSGVVPDKEEVERRQAEIELAAAKKIRDAARAKELEEKLAKGEDSEEDEKEDMGMVLPQAALDAMKPAERKLYELKLRMSKSRKVRRAPPPSISQCLPA